MPRKGYRKLCKNKQLYKILPLDDKYKTLNIFECWSDCEEYDDRTWCGGIHYNSKTYESIIHVKKLNKKYKYHITVKDDKTYYCFNIEEILYNEDFKMSYE